MKHLLSLEELAQLVVAIAALFFQPIALPYWAWPLAFFTPDLGMLGYVAGPLVGAWTYNLFHHKAVALAIISAGWAAAFPVLTLVGLLLFAHSAFDRLLGYGLKYNRGFKFTHLGELPAGRKTRNGAPAVAAPL